MSPFAAILGAAALWAAGPPQDPAQAPDAPPQELVIDHPDPAFRTRLPRGYRMVRDERGDFHYERPTGSADWERIRVRLYPGPAEVAQDGPLPPPGEISRPAGLAAGTAVAGFKAEWMEFKVDAEEARYIDREKNLEITAYFARVPLASRSVTIGAFAPRVLEKEARQDFLWALRNLEGRTNWATGAERNRRREASLLVYGGLGAMGAYLLAWLLFFRGQPMKAHLFRTLFLVLIALAFMAAMVRGGGMLYLLVPSLLYLSLAGRRLKMAIEEGD